MVPARSRQRHGAPSHVGTTTDTHLFTQHVHAWQQQQQRRCRRRLPPPAASGSSAVQLLLQRDPQQQLARVTGGPATSYKLARKMTWKCV
jgi:predicted phage-related endonuclease